MSKLTPAVDRAPGHAPTAIGLLDSRLATLLNRTQSLGLAPSVVVTGGGLVLIGLIGWINFHAHKGLDFDYYYLLVCAFVGWLGGTRGALACSLGSVVVLVSSEVAQGLAPSVWVAGCNAVVRLVAFSSISWLAAEVGRSTRDLRQAIASRTARLE